MRKGVPAQIKPFSLPLAMILVLLVLTFLVLKPIFARVQSLRQETRKLVSTNQVLQNKVSTLQGFSPFELEERVRVATTAVPTQNSALLGVFLIRQKASENGIAVSNLQTSLSQTSSGGLNEVVLRGEVEGPLPSLITFFDQLEQSLPLARVSKGSLVSVGASGQVSSEVVVFWQELPESLPKVDEAVKVLTQDEEALVSQISTYPRPQTILENLPAGVSRENPFSF